MKISDVPDTYKVFTVRLSNGERITLTGTQKNAMLESTSNLVELPNEKGFNKNFVVSWSVDIEATRENVVKHKEEIEKAIAK